MSIYVVGHKPFTGPAYKEYVPIQVGEGENFLPVRDNTGDNIAEKNKNFCELTALYWMWKNDSTSEFIGLNHYRRYFDFKEQRKRLLYSHTILPSQLNQYTNPKDFQGMVDETTIILPKPLSLGKLSIFEQYQRNHLIQDLDVVIDIIKSNYPEYTEALHKVLQRHWVYLCNMFIMTRSQFEAYAAWLFAILFQAEKMIVLTGDVYQDRVFGFLAERLFNVYVEKQKFKIIEVPAIFVDPAVHSDSTQRIGKRALLKDLFS